MITGLFEPSHMQYSYDRDQEKEPSLSEMTVKALEILQKNDNGFFLMVEGEKIILSRNSTKHDHLVIISTRSQYNSYQSLGIH